MPYFTLDEVRAGMPAGVTIDDQSSFPSSTQVAQEIIGVENQLDAACKKGGISLPITDASALGVFKIKGAREVRYQVMAIRAAAESEKVKPLYLQWHEEFTNPKDGTGLIQELETTGLAGLVNTANLPWSSTMDADPNDPADSKNPEFTKDYVP